MKTDIINLTRRLADADTEVDAAKAIAAEVYAQLDDALSVLDPAETHRLASILNSRVAGLAGE